jgi:hypothetical protein
MFARLDLDVNTIDDQDDGQPSQQGIITVDFVNGPG